MSMSDLPADWQAHPSWQPPASGQSRVSAPSRLAPREQREISGIDPFVELRYRRRGRSISRIVNVRLKSNPEGLSEAFELFFAIG